MKQIQEKEKRVYFECNRCNMMWRENLYGNKCPTCGDVGVMK